MNIYFTYDYEIYFGENHGTVEKCIIQPTNELIRISDTHDVKFVFFVDSGFIIKLNEYRQKFPQLEKDYTAITQQIKHLSDTGHDIQLHIHSHWEDSYFDGNKWIINTKRYKLADFSETEINDIVSRYKKVLTDITSKKIFAFRAGGWCIQPFSKFKKVFILNGITLDSSVFKNGKFYSNEYSYDFTNAPDKDIYKFDNDVLLEDEKGYFTEVPISGIKNSPLFFWKLFLLGRKNPYLHKPLGDGKAMPAPGYRKKLLTRFTNNPISVDGYNAQLLDNSLRKLMRNKKENMVIIGHPKALSRYSIQKIEAFVINNKMQHHFTTFEKQFLR
ncbi:MAG: hypothetical protein JNL69_01540 [Bacteroidia bacterium]|nr:hypothetical protein [Bacteroidia bacterium]